MVNKKVKILVSYHKPADLLKTSIFCPIHVGRAIATQKNKDGQIRQEDFDWLNKNLIGDDTGDNISVKNRNYCELTAQYWAWKNSKALENPDYIGFMHYRRHLSFNENSNFSENKWGLVESDFITDDYIEKMMLNEIGVQSLVQKYDLIIAKGWDVRNAKSKNNYDHYKSSDKKLFIKDYDLALKILLNKYPQYKQAIENYNSSNIGYYTNIFIARKDIYEEYCTLLFDVLFELENQIDISKYSLEEARVFGYISEWLFGIFVTYKKLTNSCVVKELQRTIINNTNRNDIILCFSTDDDYAQHLGVAIESIIQNKASNDYFEFNIIDGDISEINKKKLINVAHGFKINFIKIDVDQFHNFPITPKCRHISLATYYRFLVAEIFKNYNKILYLDCDLVVNSSLSDLFNIDLGHNYFAGVQDILFDENIKRLGLNKYCNAGVMLINLELWRQNNICSRLFEYVNKNSHKIKWCDQDVLNDVLQDGIIYINKKWNAQTGEYPPCYETGFNEIGKTAFIVHFIGDRKPWNIVNEHPFRFLYFKYLKKTPWKNFKKVWLRKRFFSIHTLRMIFSLHNEGNLKILNICGIKLKFKRSIKS